MPRHLEDVDEVLVAKGRNFARFDLQPSDRASIEEVAGLVVGRWGKLRAPAMRVGRKLVVGFNREMLESVFDQDPPDRG